MDTIRHDTTHDTLHRYLNCSALLCAATELVNGERPGDMTLTDALELVVGELVDALNCSEAIDVLRAIATSQEAQDA